MTTKTPWQQRLKATGISQVRLAAMLGRDDTTIYRALTGRAKGEAARYVLAAVIAAEVMTAEQRTEWLRRVDAELADGEGDPAGIFAE